MRAPPLTAYRDIRKLEPGHSLRYTRAGEIKLERYWQPDFSQKTKMSEEEAGERAVEILREAVRVRLMSEVPLGAFLSGGVDSSAVVAARRAPRGDRIQAVRVRRSERRSLPAVADGEEDVARGRSPAASLRATRARRAGSRPCGGESYRRPCRRVLSRAARPPVACVAVNV